MSRANPFGDLDDFVPQVAAKPVRVEAIEQIAQASGFPSRKAAEGAGEGAAGGSKQSKAASAEVQIPVPRAQRRRTTGRNRQINIKATEETIERLYRVADALDLPLGAVLDQALEALEKGRKA